MVYQRGRYRSRWNDFQVTRNETNILHHGIRNAVTTGIVFGNNLFEMMDAPVKCGASLDELEKWMNGDYSIQFMKEVVAYYRMSSIIDSHKDDAVYLAMERKRKAAGKKG